MNLISSETAKPLVFWCALRIYTHSVHVRGLPFPGSVMVRILVYNLVKAFLFPVQEVAELQQQLQSSERENQRLRQQLTTKTKLLVHTITYMAICILHMLFPFPTFHSQFGGLFVCVCVIAYMVPYVWGFEVKDRELAQAHQQLRQLVCLVFMRVCIATRGPPGCRRLREMR